MMDFGGTFLFVQLFNLVLLAAWLTLTLTALFNLRKRTRLHAAARALWAILIVCVPILGAVAYWIVRPEADQQAG